MLISRRGMSWHQITYRTYVCRCQLFLPALLSAARGDLVIPRTRRRLGNRAFSVAGPAAWNSLPPDIRTASTLCTFKNLLKTHLFFHSFQLSTWFRKAYAVRRPCSDFMDMLRRLISCRIIIIIIIIIIMCSLANRGRGMNEMLDET